MKAETENEYMYKYILGEQPIIYPKDCYPRNKVLGEWMVGKVQVSKEQWDLIINEVRCWIPDNIHLEMNLGTHFEINDEYQAKRKKEDDKFLDNYIPSHLKEDK